MVEPIYCLQPAWCGRHLAGLRPETGLTVRYGATALKAVGCHLRTGRWEVALCEPRESAARNSFRQSPNQPLSFVARTVLAIAHISSPDRVRAHRAGHPHQS